MEKKNPLLKYVQAALVHLRIEKFIFTAQTAIFLALLSAIFVFCLSRLFVFPHYERVTLWTVIILFGLFLVYAYLKRVPLREALLRLDAYLPHNLLITALSVQNDASPFVKIVREEAELTIENAFDEFKKRKKNYIHSKMLIGIICSSACLLLLYLFPSEAQLEAQTIVKENEVIEEMKKEVEQLIDREKETIAKKELEDLQEKLEEAENSSEALMELIKKQKELRLQEQQLAEQEQKAAEGGGEALSEEEKAERLELQNMSVELAKQASQASRALNDIGKAPELPALAQSIESLLETGNSSSNEGQGGQEGNSERNSGSGEAAENKTGSDPLTAGEENASNGRGEGQGSGQQQNNGTGQGEGTGQGASQGSGQGGGTGTGQNAGNGQGKGSGGRDLLSIPNDRVGSAGDSSVDQGKLNEGEFIEEEVEGQTTRGTIRSYEDVIGDYEKSYVESTEKMQLPANLKKMLSDYFSALQ